MVRSFKIGNEEINELSNPLIVAEIGINHGGSLGVAKLMVDAACTSGCQIVKHQTHCVDDEMSYHAKEIYPVNANESIWDIIEKCALTFDEEIELKKYTENKGMIYLSTPFSGKALDFLVEIGVIGLKIGSGEISNPFLLEMAANTKLPVIISTGMADLKKIKKVYEIFETNENVAFLECTNSYPCPAEYIYLNGITLLKNMFPKNIIGFSDHSIGPWISLAAIAKGAKIIERHFTDDKSRIGPDIACSSDAFEMKILVEKGKDIVAAINNKTKKREKIEESVYSFARASIVSKQNLKKGHIIRKSDIWSRRPGNGDFAAWDRDQVIGKELIKNLNKGDQISFSDLKKD
ncbi:N-acetylneuraminate synthase family protein [Alphaproteobacteria bacterium]|nr:N-acetylneuraminate synthase family protein [Alphaproteobacteria bacterium]